MHINAVRNEMCTVQINTLLYIVPTGIYAKVPIQKMHIKMYTPYMYTPLFT